MRKQKVYFLKGLPASGKSTWAKQKIEEDRHEGIVTKRVNKDELRAMLDNSVHSKEREKFVNDIQYTIMTDALLSGYNVIVDNTHFNPAHFDKVQELTQEISNTLKKDLDLEVKFFDTPVQECIRRDADRPNYVGKAVIMDMYNKYLAKDNQPKKKFNPELMDCIVVDVDGTLALRGNRSPYDYWKAGEDELNLTVADLVHHIQYSIGIERNIATIIATGRENLIDEDGFTVSDLTQKWLKKYGINFNSIYIRENGDKRPDWQVKEEIYRNYIEDYYNVLYWIDDRKQVIDHMRSIGVMVIDVAGHEF